MIVLALISDSDNNIFTKLIANFWEHVTSITKTSDGARKAEAILFWSTHNFDLDNLADHDLFRASLLA